eukprot:COSAG02_NODE_57_length_43668_cov_118.217196_35_plen_98_part_00
MRMTGFLTKFMRIRMVSKAAVLFHNNLLRLYTSTVVLEFLNSVLTKPWYQIVDRNSRISRARCVLRAVHADRTRWQCGKRTAGASQRRRTFAVPRTH